MAGQRTFTVLPPISGPTRVSDDPTPQIMTSKQVQKAYRAATRMPRMTREERRRQELAEQARIRLELDKETAARKARAAREKKKEKQAQERFKRKRERRPLVDVRPSQDTIARFVRAGSEAKKNPREEVEGVDAKQRQIDSDVRPPVDECQYFDPDEDDQLQKELLELDADLAVRQESPVAALAPRSQPYVATNYQGDDATALALGGDDAMACPGGNEAATCQGDDATVCPGYDQGLANDEGETTMAPPVSTQAILGNVEEFFPSTSQLERELDDDQASDASAVEISPAPRTPVPRTPVPRTPVPRTPAHQTPARAPSFSSPQSPAGVKLSPQQDMQENVHAQTHRFFTASGSQELVSLALQRSRRFAELQDFQHKELERLNSIKRRKSNGLSSSQTRGARVSKARDSTTPRTDKKPLSLSRNQTPSSQARARLAHSETYKAYHRHLTPEKNKENMVPLASQESDYGGAWVDDLALELVL